MGNIVVERLVAAPPEKVFAIVTDIPNVPKIQPAITNVEMLTEGPIGVGTKWSETRKEGGREMTLTLEITQFDAPHSYTVEADAMNTHYVTRIDCEAQGGGTLARMTADSTPRGFIAKLTDGMIIKMMRKGLADDLETLAKAAEGG